jgi:hypothetical protein
MKLQKRFIFEQLPRIISESRIETCNCALAKDLKQELEAAAIMQYCPVVVGGYAYYYYMATAGREAETLFSDDIDIKVTIQKTVEELNSSDTLLRTLIKTFRFNIIRNVQEAAILFCTEKSMPATFTVGGTYKGIVNLYKSIKTAIYPLELCYIITNYNINGMNIQMGLMDTSFYVESENDTTNYLKQFSMYREYISEESQLSAKNIIGNYSLCAEGNCAWICNELYLLLDTVRMLSKVEPIGDANLAQPAKSDYYKFAKYVVKFLQLLNIPKMGSRIGLTGLTEEDSQYMQYMYRMIEEKSHLDLGVYMHNAHQLMLKNAPNSLYARAYTKLYSPLLQGINARMNIGGATKSLSNTRSPMDMDVDTQDVLHTHQTNRVLVQVRENEKQELLNALNHLSRRASRSSSKSKLSDMSL